MKTLNSKMTIQNNIDNIKEVMSWIKAELKPLFEISEKYDSLQLCLQEALTNAIVHGNQLDEKKSVKISYTINHELKVTIEDEGTGVLPKNQNKNIRTIQNQDLLNESGRGIMLMKHFCDDVTFKNNCVTLVIQYK